MFNNATADLFALAIIDGSDPLNFSRTIEAIYLNILALSSAKHISAPKNNSDLSYP